MSTLMTFLLMAVLASCAPTDGPTTTARTPTVNKLPSPTQDRRHISTTIPATATAVDSTATPTNVGTIQVACPESEGRIERVEYSSQLVGEYIPVLIYLPACYSEEREYPTLYLLHGKPQDENHWLILGIDELVNQRIMSGELDGLILVMPKQPEPLFSQTDGGPGSYEGEFLSNLVPFIDSLYSTSSRSDQRAVAGISRGGVWALEIGFRTPASFSGVAALSPALNVNEAREDYDPLIIAKSVSTFSERIFLASGDVDSAAAETRLLHEILVQRGVSHRYTTVPGGHEGGTWQQLIGEMLDYLIQGW